MKLNALFTDGALCIRSNGKTGVDILRARTTIHQLLIRWSYVIMRFLARDALFALRGIATVSRPSVRLSLRPSVTVVASNCTIN